MRTGSRFVGILPSCVTLKGIGSVDNIVIWNDFGGWKDLHPDFVKVYVHAHSTGYHVSKISLKFCTTDSTLHIQQTSIHLK